MVDADQVVGLTCSVLHVPCVLMMSSLHCSSLLLCFCVFQLLQYTLLNIGTLRSPSVTARPSQITGSTVTDVARRERVFSWWWPPSPCRSHPTTALLHPSAWHSHLHHV